MQKKIVFEGKKYSYRIDGEGAVILLLHGYLEDSTVWGDYFDKLTQEYRLVALDLPGHGESGFDNHFSFARIVSLINSVLSEEQISEIYLVGHSLGGYISFEYLRLFPLKVKGLILINSICQADSQSRIKFRRKESRLINSGMKARMIAFGFGNNFTERYKDGDELNFKKLVNRALSVPEECMKACVDTISNRICSLQLIKSSTIPLVSIHGSMDVVYSKEEFFVEERELACRMFYLRKGKHMIHLESPKIIFRQIQKLFL